jgi:hypothetical protein
MFASGVFPSKTDTEAYLGEWLSDFVTYIKFAEAQSTLLPSVILRQLRYVLSSCIYTSVPAGQGKDIEQIPSGVPALSII